MSTDAEDVVQACKATSKKCVLSTPRIDRAIRKHFSGKRVSSGSSVYAAAAIESILSEIVIASDEKRAAGKAKRIDRKTLIAAVRSHPGLARLFRSYAFLSETAIKIKREALLTKGDKEALQKKREQEKEEKKKKGAVPGVDED